MTGTLPNVKEAVRKDWNILQISNELKNVFPEPPIMCFRRNKNLKDFRWTKMLKNEHIQCVIHLFCFQQSLIFYTLRWRGLHSSIFALYAWLRSFSTLVPWYLDLNFYSEIIKQNLEWHNWRRMCDTWIWTCNSCFTFPLLIFKWLLIFVWSTTA